MFLLWLRQLPRCGYQTPASVPLPAEGRFSPTNFPVSPLVASSYQVFGGSIYSFPLVRYSCPEFCMHFYVWRCIPECIHGERRTPRPPTPPPSCSPQDEDFKSALDLLMKRWIFKKCFLCRNGQSHTGEDWGGNRRWRSRNLFWKKVPLWGMKTE